MMDIDTPTVRRLRDLLLESGPVSTQRSRPPVSVRNPERDAVVERVEALVETMFLMMKADNEQSEDELEALRGAIRNLTDRAVPTRVINRMLGEFETRLTAEGRESRLQQVAAQLSGERRDAETAFSLAAAIALADDHGAPEAIALLEELGDWRGISAKHRTELLGPSE